MENPDTRKLSEKLRAPSENRTHDPPTTSSSDALTTEPLETLRQAGTECLVQPMLELISVRGSKSAQGNWTEMYLPGLESQIRPPKKNCI